MNPWLESRTLPTGGPVSGYVHHASRVERRLGLILWIALAVVLVAGSL